MSRILYMVILFCAFLTSAQTLSPEQDLFQKLEYEAQYGKRAVYQRLLRQLDDYPLTPYAQALYLSRHMTYRNKNAITEFLTEYDNAPFSVPLRKKWLSYLANKRYKKTFIEQYVDIGDARLACLNLRWQLQQGAESSKILPQVTALWLAPNSQPRACDPLFNIWKRSGYLTSDVALQRIVLAAKNKNWPLIPYLKSLLDDDQKYMAGLWRSVVRRSRNIFKDNLFLFHNANEKQLFLYGLHKQVFAQPKKVAKLWQEKSEQFNISDEEAMELAKKLALSFAIADREEGLHWLAKVPDEEVDESVKQWRLAITLDDRDWQNTLNVLAGLPEQMQTDLSVVYWKARALEGLGQDKWAQRSYAELAERRDYYGFLAANKLGVQAQLRHVPLEVDYKLITSVKMQPNLKRAYELFKLGRSNQARREWNVLETLLTDEQKLVAAKLAYDWGWYDRPIFMLADVGHLNDVNMRFPLAYKSLMSKVAKQNNLDPALLFAIARRESSFMHDAYSNAGAAGLMQLKPSTASYIAKSKVRRGQLFSPDKNVELASVYWSYLLKQTKGNPVLTTAAYNAGINKVKKWLPDDNMPADAWIETIPYKETRNYVKAVVAYSTVYQQLLSQQEHTFSEVPNINISPSL